MNKNTQVSITVIRRLPKYYRYLGDLKDKGISRISSQELSNLTGFTASQIRQDLNNFGGFGQQGYGYNVEDLHMQLGKILGLDKKYKAVVAGAGNLGHAIANYRGFRDAGFDIMCAFDRNEEKVGKKSRGIEIKHLSELEQFVKDNEVNIGIITSSEEIAQNIADTYVRAGVQGIWNFAGIDLVVPDNIVMETVRLNESLFTISYFLRTLEE